MPQPQRTEQSENEHEGMDLRGTLVSVTILGIIIIISWIGVWYLFISR
ncbi:cytochrome c oxidase subunit 2A [Pseudogracilibacillus auburnensis]|uniref:Cytochrome c oxidase subunit IIa family protein n=1 Tax=Pseudogracilibacillus auburnensis TaxID=1494959 RepID=A0A2V3VWF9_9BACI|nr:cytochrome c oxidase subunit 2A [Pseudogracilibacillus auburnensis]MBO1004619.1 cytochrome c oxidase subunit 2A [Pseudogracilibacillus auburnensis]PXW85171.1 cytochrome c oxidase subunit IIa family protein [Pseudogracilibacillus auburnensis]